MIALANEAGIEVEERKISTDELFKAIEEGRVAEAFGTGTAATISHISDIGYRDRNYELPPITDDLFSSKVKIILDDLKKGRREDSHNWLFNVERENASLSGRAPGSARE